VIFSGDENVPSEKAIVEYGQCRHLGRLPRLDPLTPASLADAVARDIRMDLLA
jgi:dethiobiotin synthetase